jgi:hypothetical protein
MTHPSMNNQNNPQNYQHNLTNSINNVQIPQVTQPYQMVNEPNACKTMSNYSKLNNQSRLL